MMHLRLVAPPDLAGRALQLLEDSPACLAIVHLPGVARNPHGDLVLCDLAREDASVILEGLRELGLDRRGTITLEAIDSAPTEFARRAVRAVGGAPADAVVWEEVEERTSESAELSWSFAAFMVLATLIAAVGIITDSIILIIGAMVVGPEFGPLAGISVAIVQRRRALARRSLTALGAGFVTAITATTAGTLLLRITDTAPDVLDHEDTLFITDPNRYSVIVAVLAGIAGVLSLTTAKSGALIGVLISVTTIPAAGNVGVAAAYGDWDEFGGALAQLAINIVAILAAAVLTLSFQRAAYRRRLARGA